MSNAHTTLTAPLTVTDITGRPIVGDDRLLVELTKTGDDAISFCLYADPEQVLEVAEGMMAIALDRDKLLVPTWARELAELAAATAESVR